MRPFVSGCDAVLTISKELAQNVPHEFDISPEKVKTVYNGIDTDRFKPAKSGIKEDWAGKKLLLSVSVLHRQKGVQYLITALKRVCERVPNAHLLVVGDGPHRRHLEELTRKLGLGEKVSFIGSKPNTELREYYNACDIFVIPTIRVEGLPLIELEAMACGKPVVASNIGGIPSVIEDRVNGLLVEPGDTKSLAERIIEVLEDRELANRLGSKARETIMGGFSREKMVEDTIKVYRECIG